MDYSLITIILFSGLYALACCVISLVHPSQKGQVLFRLWR